MTATKIVNGIESFMAATHLKADDIILIKPGETIPADSEIITGTSQINEAMLSGEQQPLTKTSADSIYAGTINGDGNLTAKVQHNNQESFLSQLIRLSENAQSHKPKLAKLSDKKMVSLSFHFFELPMIHFHWQFVLELKDSS